MISRSLPHRRERTRRPATLARSSRTGASLIELLIVLSTLAFILATSTVTLFRLLQAQSSSAESLANTLTVNRLSSDLRRDAHAATSVTLEASDETQTLTLGGAPRGEVVYVVESGQLQRRGTTSAGIAVRENYELGLARARLELAESGRLVVLNMTEDRAQSAPVNHAASSLPNPVRKQMSILAAVPGAEKK